MVYRVTRTIYLAAAEGSAGKRVLAVGVIDALQAKGHKVGIFRPVVSSRERDALAASLIDVCGLAQNFPDAIGATYDEVAADPESAIASMVAKMGSLGQVFDDIVVIGSNFSDVATPVEVSLNARIAANLDAPVVILVSGRDKDATQVLHSAQYAFNEFTTWHNNVLGIVACRVDPSQLGDVATRLEIFSGLFTAVIPESQILVAPTVRQQLDALGAKVWKASEQSLDREAMHVAVSGMTLPNLLDRIHDETTLIVASDRVDLLPGLLMSQSANGFPKLSALILVGGYPVPELITQLIENSTFGFAIATVDDDSFTAAQALANIEGSAMVTPRKVAELRSLLLEHAHIQELIARLDQPRRSIRTQHRFEYDIVQQAKANLMTIVLPESEDPRVLQAAATCHQRGVAKLVLLGEAEQVRAQAAKLGDDLAGVEIVSMQDQDRLERYTAAYAQLRQAKGVTIEQARTKMAIGSYFGTMMVKLGEADAMVSGACHTTADTIRPAFEIIKTKPGVSTVSGALFMCMADQVWLFADCAVTPNPTPEQLAGIAISSAESAAAFGIEPRVAMLSYSTGTSGAGPSVDAVVEATAIVHQRRPDLLVDGPMQFDAAVSASVASLKMPNSPAAGQATVFVFPDLNAGNIAYKAVQRSAGAVAIGPILQGLNKTVTDLSRGASVEDIVSTIAITAVQAQAG